MTYRTTKKILMGVLAASLFALQIPTAVFAATDQDAYTAALKGVTYLKNNQGNDGSIATSGFGGETDWAIIAAAAAGVDMTTFKNGSGVTAVDFIKNDTPTAKTDATDIARRIIAINAAGEDSSNFGGTNYNAALAALYSNNQYGDATGLNDDMFAIIAIAASHDASLVADAQDSLNFLIANQEADGGFSYTTLPCSWTGCTDSDSNDTAAALVALRAASNLGLTNANLATAQANALTYLLGTQQPDGGFGYDQFGPSDGGSTSWCLMALNAVGNNVKTQAASARNWLLGNQNSDGGFSYGAYNITKSDTNTTPGAVIALLGTTWLLDPTPLQAPAPVEPTPTPTPTPVITNAPSPTAPEQPATTKPVTTTNDNQVLAAEITTTPQPEQTPQNTPATNNTKDQTTPTSKTNSSISKYLIYSAIALALIGFGWYLFQPKKG